MSSSTGASTSGKASRASKNAALHVRWSPHFYFALMALAVSALWPDHIAVPKLSLSGWTHLDSLTGSLWLSMLIVLRGVH
jgi:hypothetical protein